MLQKIGFCKANKIDCIRKSPSPDGSGYPFVPIYGTIVCNYCGTKDRSEQREIAPNYSLTCLKFTQLRHRRLYMDLR
jgi:hypothetical protein